MAGFGVDGGATGVGIGDFAGRFEGVEIKDGDAGASSGAWDVETASGGVRIDVIETACAADFRGFEDFVGAGVLGEGEGG